MRKIYAFWSIVILISMMLTFTVQAIDYSEVMSENPKYEEYVSLKEAGVIGSDVDFETWKEFLDKSSSLERELSANVALELVYDSSDPHMARANNSYTMTTGDVLVTNGTTSSGILGHAGMVILISSTKMVLHIEGPGKTPAVINMTSWHNRYTNAEEDSWTKIYRHTSTSVANEAAAWNKETYMNSNATYQINTDLHGTSKTYCSKMVWQAFYYGPSTPAATYYDAGIIGPYDLAVNIPGLRRNITIASGV